MSRRDIRGSGVALVVDARVFCGGISLKLCVEGSFVLRGPCLRVWVCRIVRCDGVIFEGPVHRLPWMLVYYAVDMRGRCIAVRCLLWVVCRFVHLLGGGCVWFF